jgi:membrane protease YdiL (CAAX protease family)
LKIAALTLAVAGAMFDTSRGAGGFIDPWLGHLVAAIAGVMLLGRAAAWDFPSIGLSATARPSWAYWGKIGAAALAVIGALVGIELAVLGRLRAPEIVYGARIVELLVLSPILEELVYRLCICRVLADQFGAWLGVIASSTLFIAVHFLRGNLDVSNAAAGFVFAFALLRSRTVAVPIVFHIAGNGAALLLNVFLGATHGYPVIRSLTHWNVHP